MIIFNNPSDICDFYINTLLAPGDIAIDATVGNGNDTLKLSNAVGEKGRVYGFDIQQSAINSAKCQNYVYDNVEFITASHSDMDIYVHTGIKLAIFNLGYLPGGDHSISTKYETTLPAIEKALSLLVPGGAIVLVIYSGGDTGFEERDCVREYLKSIDYKKYNALHFDYTNRPKNPPSVCVIQKKK